MDQNETIVWVIEDNEPFRRELARLLNRPDGMACPFTFSQCEDAIDLLKKESPPDIILSDIGLPGMSGIEGIGIIKGIAPSVHVIVLTIHDDENNVFDAICAGASGYLLKASSLDFILESIRVVQNGGAPITPRIARKILDRFTQFTPTKDDYGLTERENQILQYLVDGCSKQKIADTIFLSPHTVDSHIRNIYTKLQVHSRSGAVARAIRERLV